MATFISLVNYTDQGIRNVKQSPDRYASFKATAQQIGVEVKAIYWTVGHYDVVLILDGPDDAVTAALLTLGSLGNVRTETLRAYSVDAMTKLISAMP
jgi:uncharacterized protein with GYD domain